MNIIDKILTPKKEFYLVTLEASKGNAYEYSKSTPIPTTIKFRRFHDGKFEVGKISDNFTNLQMHDILYLIKRGHSLLQITNHINHIK